MFSLESEHCPEENNPYALGFRSRSKSSSNIIGDRRNNHDPASGSTKRYRLKNKWILYKIGIHFIVKNDSIMSLSNFRCCNVEQKSKQDELYMFPPAQFQSSYQIHGLTPRERHPLSQSSENIFYTDDTYDPQPIVPNRSPGTPDVWLPRTILRA